MRSFQKLFSKICIFWSVAPAICVFLGPQNLNLSIFRVFKNVFNEHTFHFHIKSVPPGFWLLPLVKI